MKISGTLRIAVLVTFAAALASALPVAAQDYTTTVEYAFGSRITFTLTLPAAQELAEASLVVRPLPAGESQVINATLPGEAGDGLTLQAQRDLVGNPLPPYSEVEYHWVLRSATGEEIETVPESFVYEDNRFEWRASARDGVGVHWYDGELAFGQAATDVAAAAVQSIAAELDASAPAYLEIYIYSSTSDMQSGLRLGGRDWVGGHADVGSGVVLVAIAPGAEHLLIMRRVLPHEVTHVVVRQMVGTRYGAVPGWLNEGLAVLNERDGNPVYLQVLDAAVQENALLPLRRLCGSFPADGDEAVLAYAQSGSLVEYLTDQHGTATVIALLQAYADGSTCEGGVQRVLQTDLPGLQAEWERNHLRASPFSTALRAALLAIAILLLPILSLAAPALPLRWRQRA